MKKDKKIVKIIALLVSAEFILSPSALLLAEDYPSEYLGPGNREYLSNKIQNGYYVDVFSNMDIRQKERVNKRNEIEKIVASSYQAAPQAANGILALEFQKKFNTDNLKAEIARQQQQREQVASAQLESGFSYIPRSDGKIEYFKDGLLTRVENERVIDQSGNVSIKNTYNIQYNDKRLMTSSEASIRDNAGNITRLSWYGARYTGDSVYYGNTNTSANKNLSEYYLKEIDPAGNEKLTHWQAEGFAGKVAQAFHQRIEDAIYGIVDFTRSKITYHGNNPEQPSSYHEEGIGADGLAYSLDRTDIGYTGKNQISAYHEESATFYPGAGAIKKTTQAQFKYLGAASAFGADVEEAEPDNLSESIITTATENPDGSKRTETAATTYKYEGAQIAGASGKSEFSGQEAKWYEYTDAAGHILTRNEDANGKVTYSYLADPVGNESITVPAGQVTTTLKDGSKFNGASTIEYEIISGKPMAKNANSLTSYYSPTGVDLLRKEETTLNYSNGRVNNLERLLNIKELTQTTYYPLVDPNGLAQIGIKEITTDYTYTPNGNLDKARGKGKGSGYEFTNIGWMNYTSGIVIDYEVILGEAKQKLFEETKDYKNL